MGATGPSVGNAAPHSSRSSRLFPSTATRRSTSGSTSARTFAMTELPMSSESIARTGTTLNDVYLCVCAGARNTTCKSRGELPHRAPCVASVPISTDPNVARMWATESTLCEHRDRHAPRPGQRLDYMEVPVTAASKEVRTACSATISPRGVFLPATDLPFGRRL